MIIGKVRPSIYLCSMAIVWSSVSAATCGVRNFQGLVVVRFFLGLVEAPLLPGAVYLLSCWYTRKEIAFRVAILYSAQTLAFCVAGLIAAAVYGTLEQRYGLAGWQWLFIVLAVTGSGLAIIALFLLPDYPDSKTGSASWTMTEDMRKVAAMRILVDRPSTAEAKPGVWHGFKLAVKDPKLWILTMMNISISAAYGFSNFFPSVSAPHSMVSFARLLMLPSPDCPRFRILDHHHAGAHRASVHFRCSRLVRQRVALGPGQGARVALRHPRSGRFVRVRHLPRDQQRERPLRRVFHLRRRHVHRQSHDHGHGLGRHGSLSGEACHLHCHLQRAVPDRQLRRPLLLPVRRRAAVPDRLRLHDVLGLPLGLLRHAPQMEAHAFQQEAAPRGQPEWYLVPALCHLGTGNR